MVRSVVNAETPARVLAGVSAFSSSVRVRALRERLAPGKRLELREALAWAVRRGVRPVSVDRPDRAHMPGQKPWAWPRSEKFQRH